MVITNTRTLDSVDGAWGSPMSLMILCALKEIYYLLWLEGQLHSKGKFRLLLFSGLRQADSLPSFTSPWSLRRMLAPWGIMVDSYKNSITDQIGRFAFSLRSVSNGDSATTITVIDVTTQASWFLNSKKNNSFQNKSPHIVQFNKESFDLDVPVNLLLSMEVVQALL